MAASRTVFDVIERERLIEHAASLGERRSRSCRNDPRIASKVAQIRGRGLMLGIELKDPIDKIVEKALERGVIINLTATKVIRIAPAINISRQEWEQGLDTFIDVLAKA